MIFLAFMIASQDILLPIAISKLESLFHVLTMKVSEVTNSSDQKVNESNLNECIELHIDTLEALKMFRNCFGVSICLRTFFMMIILAAAILNTVINKVFNCEFN
jgi:hypothetical protein